jgi:hypothetical protein
VHAHTHTLHYILTSKKPGEEEERFYLTWRYCFASNDNGGAKTIVAHDMVEVMAGEGFFFVFFLSNVRNFIDQNETKLETSKSEYTGMYIQRLRENAPLNNQKKQYSHQNTTI